jgi:pilus assembly protein CpaF
MNLQVSISHDQHHERRALGALRSITIGRDADCTITLDSALVSRRHVTLAIADGVMRVQDSSRNGTLAGALYLNHTEREVPLETPLVIGQYTVSLSTSAAEPARPVQTEANAPAAHVEERAIRELAPPAPLSPNDAENTPPSARESGARERAREVAAEATQRDAISLRREIHRLLLEHLDLAKVQARGLEDPSLRPKVLTALRQIVETLGDRIPAELNRDALVGEMADEALGLGPLENLLSDPSINEIMVVDPDTIYVERRGKLVRSRVGFTDDERVRAVIERIVTPLGRRIDESSPIVDARLSDGSRVNAVVKPLALRGSAITIRKFAKSPLTLDKLIELGALSPAMARFLVRSVKAKKNLVIAGGTGSGKTTLLNVLSQAIPSDERIVTIEDAAELQLAQPHVVSLETRPANMEGKGEYSIRDLVKNALRMRPDRIVVGECRGGEALDMLQAMNTGHDGSLTTTHANSPREAIARLETLVLMAGLELPVRAIREQLAGAVHVLVQQSRLADGSRKVTAISEVTGVNDEGEVELVPIFRYVQSGTGANGEAIGEFLATGFLPTFLEQFCVLGLIRPGEQFL